MAVIGPSHRPWCVTMPAYRWYPFNNDVYLAKENGLLHQTALASERAAMFHSSALSNEVLASSYRNQARGLYLQWGAYRKATTLKK